MFDTGNKNPGPGRYFVNTDFKIKNKNRKSPDFMEPTKKRKVLRKILDCWIIMKKKLDLI